MKKKAITLLSAGLDSTVASILAMNEYDVRLALTFDYGQRARDCELRCAEGFCGKFGIAHEIIELPWLANITHTALVDVSKKVPATTVHAVDNSADDRAKAVWVPNRNGVFLSIAAAYAEAKNIDVIVAGFNREEALTFPDNSIDFLDATNGALAFSTLSHVRVESPTVRMSKIDIAKIFIESKSDPALMWCCYEGGDKNCGRCESCVRCVRAFKSIGKYDLVREVFLL